MLLRFGHLACILLGALVLFPAVAGARDATPPWSWTHPAKAQRADAPALQLAPVDQAARLSEDAAAFSAQIAEHGAANKRLRVATGNAVDVAPNHVGRMSVLPDGSTLWRLVVHADNATDLRFGFDRFAVPQGVTLHVIDPAEHVFHGPYTVADTNQFGELWLPPVAGSTLILELHAPAGVRIDMGNVHLAQVATGYRNTTEHGGPGLFGAGPSGVCNIDVICPLGDLYRDEIRAVAKFYFQAGGTYLCTGTLVNNTSGDFTPYFLTANHCISTPSEAASMTLFWNYESPTCGQHGGDDQGDNTQTGGATLIAHRADVDFSLVQLNSTPDPSFNVYYAGWDATGDLPDGSIGVHHPSGWVKAITEDDNGLSTMNSCIGGGSQTHWRTGQPYSQGTTEGGSSGSMIMVPSGDITGHDNLIIGTLSGGSAACSGSVPNSGYDCYGKFSVAWDGSSSATRLKDWLDPGNTGATMLPGVDPDGGGGGDPEISVDPASLNGSVEAGTSTTTTLTIGNTGSAVLSWNIEESTGACTSPSSAPWLSVDPASGSTGNGGSTDVDVTFDAAALAEGSYSANLCVDSNDPATPLVTVPVTLTVTAGDPIFCSGFEDGKDGLCVSEPFVQPIQDPGFEETAGDTGANPFWSGSDSNGAGTPFYATAAHEGGFGVWGGGWNAPSTQTWSQDVTIASGGQRHLHYWVNVSSAPIGSTMLTIAIDGSTVETVDITTLGAGWDERSVDISAHADNAAHEVKFTYTATGSDDGNTFFDDITIEETP